MHNGNLPTTKQQIGILLRDYPYQGKKSRKAKINILNTILETKQLKDRVLTDDEVAYIKPFFRKYAQGGTERQFKNEEFLQVIKNELVADRHDVASILGCSPELARIRLNELAQNNQISVSESPTKRYLYSLKRKVENHDKETNVQCIESKV